MLTTQLKGRRGLFNSAIFQPLLKVPVQLQEEDGDGNKVVLVILENTFINFGESFIVKFFL